MSFTEDGVCEHLRGVVAGPPTPFGSDLDIERDELTADATTFYGGRIHMFLASANISEYHSPTRQERVDMTATVVDALPSGVHVLAGVGGSTASTHGLVDAYDCIGIGGMIIVPPDHTYAHEHGLLHYYEKPVEASVVPLVPYVKEFNPLINYLRDLAGLDGIAGTRCAIEDAVGLDAAADITGGGMVWADGLTEPFAVSSWSGGVEEFLTDVSGFRPEVGLTLFEALTKENWGRTREF